MEAFVGVSFILVMFCFLVGYPMVSVVIPELLKIMK